MRIDVRPSGKTTYVRDIDKVDALPPEVRAELQKVSDKFVFRANDYYLGLIDWDDPRDPIRQIIIPRAEELEDWGKLDACNEASYTPLCGIQHKYPDTVLLLCNEVCGGYCRYCFRKRLFMDDNDEVTNDVSEGIRYIQAHSEVTDVLLTGGDPLVMSTRRLREIFEALSAIDHVRIIRIGTKMPAFDPWRVLEDQELQDLLAQYSQPNQRIYVMVHFDHPRELTEPAVEGLDRLMRCGVVLANQCPVLRGVNDDPEVLAQLFRELSSIGCPPYYLFHGRPTEGNGSFALSIVRGWQIFREALENGSGLARRPRYVMSHETGKIEIVAVDEKHIYLAYHRPVAGIQRGQLLVYKRDDDAYWFDDLVPVDPGETPTFVSAPSAMRIDACTRNGRGASGDADVDGRNSSG